MSSNRGQKQPDFLYFGEVFADFRSMLGWTQADVVERGGPSKPIQTKIESGQWRSVRPKQVLEAVERAFLWPAGTGRKVLFDNFDPIEAGLGPGRVGVLTHPQEPVPQPPVGGTSQTPSEYVSGPGRKVEGGGTDDEVLRAIEQMQRDMREMERRLSERLDRLEQPGT